MVLDIAAAVVHHGKVLKLFRHPTDLKGKGLDGPLLGILWSPDAQCNGDLSKQVEQ